MSVPCPTLLRRLGVVGVGAGLLFAGMTLWQGVAGLDSDSTGPAATAVAIGFAVAMVGYVALAAGVHLARPGGEGRWPRFFTGALVVAWIALLASSALQALSSIDPDENPLNPFGGLLQAVGLVGLGVVTARAGQWSGWRRWMPLGLAVYYVAVLMVPAFAGVEPVAATESVWALGYAVLGTALITESAVARRPFGEPDVPSRSQSVR
jgi:hypothetical protein